MLPGLTLYPSVKHLVCPQGLSIVVCPLTEPLAQGSLTATIYNSNWTAYELLP